MSMWNKKRVVKIILNIFQVNEIDKHTILVYVLQVYNLELLSRFIEVLKLYFRSVHILNLIEFLHVFNAMCFYYNFKGFKGRIFTYLIIK